MVIFLSLPSIHTSRMIPLARAANKQKPPLLQQLGGKLFTRHTFYALLAPGRMDFMCHVSAHLAKALRLWRSSVNGGPCGS